MSERDDRWMELALAEARRGLLTAQPNPMVGAVLVDARDQLLATGFHLRTGLDHAERDALAKVGGRAPGATMYVTLEPCSHHGRTPPCTEAIIAAGVTRVVAAHIDPDPRVSGRGVTLLREAGIEVELGTGAAAARELNRGFITSVTRARPFFAAKIASSIDGRVATRTGQSQWITGPEARARGHRLRAEYTAVLVGRGTVMADDPQLTVRAPDAPHDRQPTRVVLDRHLGCRPGARIFDTAAAPTIVLCGPDAPDAAQRTLEDRGVLVLRDTSPRGVLEPAEIARLLLSRGLNSVLIEGGPGVLGSFVDAGLLDRVHQFVAPFLIGGTESLSSAAGLGIDSLAEAQRGRRLAVEELGADLHVTWGFGDWA